MSPAKLQRLLEEAIAHHRSGRLAEAETRYAQLRRELPRNFDVLHLSGTMAYQQGRVAEAVDLLTRALKIDPKSAVCAMRLGLALIGAGRPADAEKHLRFAVAQKPDFAEAWDNLAYCLKATDRLLEAVECHEKVVKLKPDYARGWYNFGLTRSLLGHIKQALLCHDRAIAADAGYALAHFGRAQALQQSYRIAEAVEEYGRFLEKDPNHHEARSYRLFALHYLEGITREQLFAEHVAYGRCLGEFPSPDLPNSRDPGRRLRMAILSPDLRAHSCAYFIEPILRHLDRAQFEIVLYLDHIREDEVSARLRALADVWRNFVGQPAAAVEKTIREDQPDILIDLTGHTGMTSRLPLYARRLAPVQVTYLGYPNTTGVPAMDYRFTDAVADPPGEADKFATEKLVRFSPVAWSYQPPADAPEPGPVPSAARGSIAFGCYNNISKITDGMLRVWRRVLAGVPNSRLLLKGRGLGTDPSARTEFLARLERLGFMPGQVDLLERTAGTADHLTLYQRVDIAFDSFPYHGTTTTCEALWMGAPVVALLGDRHVSRVSASLLTAIGHPEWIARDEDEYVRIAVELAADEGRLQAIRAGLRDDMRRSALLDHPGQANRFGAALRECWRHWCASEEAGILRRAV